MSLAFLRATWLVAFVIEGRAWGYNWRAVRDDVVAARSLGVRVFPSKMAAAAISGFLTGMGGAIYAQYVGYIDPDSILAGSLSILIALPAVLGGVGTLWGPMVGAAVLIPVSELTRSYLGGGGQRRRPDDLWRADRDGGAGAAGGVGQPVRRGARA